MSYAVRVIPAELALLTRPEIQDCVVLVRADEAGSRALVAYVVSSVPIDETAVRTILLAAAPQLTAQPGIVPVPAVPLTADGKPDTEALKALPVLDRLSVVALQQRLETLNSDVEVGAITVAAVPAAAPYHMDELVPAQTAAGSPASPATDARPGLGSSRPAVANGGELPPIAIPTGLSEILTRRAEAEASGTDLLFLGADGAETALSSRALFRQSTAVATGLRRSGIARGAPVVLVAPTPEPFVLGFWALVLADAIPVPMECPRRFTADTAAMTRIADLTRTDGFHRVLTSRAIAAALRQLLPQAEVLELEALVETVPDWVAATARGDDPAVLFMTSGSTGRPKGVMLTHRNVCTSVALTSVANQLTAQDVSLNWMPLDHPGPLLRTMIRCVHLGCRQIQAETAAVLGDPLRWLDWIERYRVTTTWAPNFAFALVDDVLARAPDERPRDLSSLRCLLNTAEPISLGVMRRFTEVVRASGCRADAILSSWGMAETSSSVTFERDFMAATGPDGRDPVHANLGAPIAGTSLRIVDDDGAVVAEGVVGHLQVRGPTVTTAYYADPTATEQAFTADGWFRTGDLGVIADGRLTLTGRQKEIVIVGGQNRASHEIEAVVEEAAGVERAHVAAFSMKRASDPVETLVVMFSPVASEPAAIARTIADIKRLLASRVGFGTGIVLPLPRDEFPRTSLGKPQRAALRAAFERGEYDDLVRQVEVLTHAANTLPSWFFTRSWRRKALRSRAGAVAGEIFVIGDAGGIADALRRAHPSARVVSGADLAQGALRVTRGASSDATPLRAIVYAAERLDPLFPLPSWLTDAESGAAPLELVVVARGAQTVGPGDPPLAPGAAGAAGWLRAATGGHPRVRCRHIDIGDADAEAAARFIAAELAGRENDPELALRGGNRLVPRLRRVDLRELPRRASPALVPDAAYAIISDSSPLAAALIRHLLHHVTARVLWIQPARERDLAPDAAELIRNMRAPAGAFRHVVADECDESALRSAMDLASAAWRRPLVGLFHLDGGDPGEVGAAVAGAIHRCTRATVAATRVAAAADCFALVCAPAAGPGQAVDAIARELRTTTGVPIYSIAWSGAAEPGRPGGGAVTATDGVRSIIAVLHRAPSSLDVGFDDTTLHGAAASDQLPVAPEVIAAVIHRSAAGPLPGTVIEDADRFGTRIRVRLTASDHANGAADEHHVAPRTEAERRLVEVWSEVLGLRRISVVDSFFELGGDSLRAVRVVFLARERGLAITIPLFYDHPTVERLAAAIQAVAPPAERPLVPVARPEPLPLSYAQQRMWLMYNRSAEGRAAYHVPTGRRFRGDLDTEALCCAFEQLIARHESLRTVFPAPGGVPQQRILDPRRWQLEVEDLTEIDPPAHEAEIERRWHETLQAPFDLETGPLLRTRLFRLGPAYHVAFVVMHHIVSDGWSVGVLWRELRLLYAALVRGQSPSLAPLPVQYADYTVWQASELAGPRVAEQVAFWERQLAGAPAETALPYRTSRVIAHQHRAGQLAIDVEGPLVQRLNAVSREQGATLFMGLLAALRALLHRYTGQTDLVIGAPISNRMRREIEGMIGVFVNTLVLRESVDPDRGFDDMLRRERNMVLVAYDNQDALRVVRNLSHTPAFHVLFTHQNAPGDTEPFDTVDVESFDLGTTTSEIDLAIETFERGDGLRVLFTYDLELFEPALIARMAGHFRRVIELASAEPTRPIRQLGLLDDQERQRVVVDWNRRREPPGPPIAIHALFERQADATPDAVAASFGADRLTYAALNGRADRLAARLRGIGIGPEVRVVIALEPSLALPEAMLAVLKAHGTFVAIDTRDPTDRLVSIFETVRPRAIVTTSEIALRLPRIPAEVICIDGANGTAPPSRSASTAAAIDLDNSAYIAFTSGTTGMPKGVVVSHRSVFNELVAMLQLYPLEPGDVMLQLARPVFDASIQEILWPLLSGAMVVLVPPGRNADTRYLVDAIQHHRITAISLVPTVLRYLLQEPQVDRCTSLRLAIMSGEALPPDLCSLFARQLPGARLVNTYGPTEAAIDVTSWVCSPALERVPIGVPHAGVPLYVLDGSMEPVPIGVTGELYVGGIQLARSYDRDPALTASRFVPDPFSQGGRLYRTGDLVRYRDDGVLEFSRRIDDQVKVRGLRIELGEVEAALLAHPAVRAAAALVRDAGAGERHLAAFVVCAEPAPDATQLREFVRSRLPDYMIPAVIERTDTIPLTPNRKVDRKALAERSIRSRGPLAVQPPANELELLLESLWCGALGEAAIGVDCDILGELGAHSLHAARVIAQLADELGETLWVGPLFEAPTIRSYAQYLYRAYPVAVARRFPAIAPAVTPPEPALSEADIERFAAVIPLRAAAVPATDVQRNRPAMFVLAPARSGTTLLRVMLAGHSGLFSASELHLLCFDTVDERAKALTGRFAGWAEGSLRAIMALRATDVDGALQFELGCAERGLTIQQYYAEIQRMLADRRLVDKSTSYALDPGAMRHAEEVFEAPQYIHLVRHPAAVIRSFERNRMDQALYVRDNQLSPRQVGELVWLTSHRNILAHLAHVPPERQYFLRYEDLVANPERTMIEICARFGLPFEPAMLRPYDRLDEKMVDGTRPESRSMSDDVFLQRRTIDAGAADTSDLVELTARLSTATRELAAELGYEPEAAPARGAAPRPGPTSRARSSERSARASPIQQRWFRQREANRALGDHPPLRMMHDLTVTGPLDHDAMAASLAAVVNRHWCLRTAFSTAGDQVMQTVLEPSAAPPLEFADLRFARDPAAAVHGVREQLYREPLDLAQGRVFRAGLIRLADDFHRLVFMVDHIVFDGSSLGLLVRDLFSLHNALRADSGRDPRTLLVPLDRQYIDWSEEQFRLLETEHGAALAEFWNRRLTGASPIVLPGDQRAASDFGLRRGHTEVLDPAVYAHVDRLRKDQRLTQPMVLLAVLFAALHRLSGQRDLCVTCPADARTVDLTQVIGYCAVPLIIRIQIEHDTRFRDLCRAVRQSLVEAYAWARAPLYARCSPPRELWRVAFNYQRRTTAWRVGDLRVAPSGAPPQREAYMDVDLVLRIMETEGHYLQLSLDGRTDTVVEPTFSDLARELVALAGELVENPDRRVGA